jgi:TRAP-type C4-dicarboxylate transport system permease small subunit
MVTRIAMFVLRMVRWALVGIFSVMIVATFAQVVFRYLLLAPLPWSEELARYCFVWIVFLGATLGLERGVHIGVDLLTILLPRRVQRWLTVVNEFLILAFVLVIIGASVAVVDANRLQFSPALGLQMAKIYLAIPLGMAVMALVLVRKLAEGFHRELPPRG